MGDLRDADSDVLVLRPAFGGGIRAGQVIGATNRLGEEAAERPVHFQEIFATLYHNLGINVDTARLIDPAGRPQFLVEKQPIAELT